MLLMGKSTISMAIFNSKLLVYQRVIPIKPIVVQSGMQLETQTWGLGPG